MTKESPAGTGGAWDADAANVETPAPTDTRNTPLKKAASICAGESDNDLIAVLKMFDQSGDLHLAAICADAVRPPLFHAVAGDFAAAAMWIANRNADRRNIYWQPNCVRSGLTSKASATDIVAIRYFQVDIDPPKDRSTFDVDGVVHALNNFAAPPSFIVHSGGGVQAFWRLSEPVDV